MKYGKISNRLLLVLLMFLNKGNLSGCYPPGELARQCKSANTTHLRWEKNKRIKDREEDEEQKPLSTRSKNK